MAEQKLNEETEHMKEVFYANNFAFWLNNNEATIDFRQSTARNDVVNNENVLFIVHKHQAITMPPQIAKMLSILLTEQISLIEKKEGEIRLPENWKASRPAKVTKVAGGTESYR